MVCDGACRVPGCGRPRWTALARALSLVRVGRPPRGGRAGAERGTPHPARGAGGAFSAPVGAAGGATAPCRSLPLRRVTVPASGSRAARPDSLPARDPAAPRAGPRFRGGPPARARSPPAHAPRPRRGHTAPPGGRRTCRAPWGADRPRRRRGRFRTRGAPFQDPDPGIGAPGNAKSRRRCRFPRAAVRLRSRLPRHPEMERLGCLHRDATP